MVQPRSFTVRGSRNGSKVHVSWTDGQLSGDPPTVDLVTVEAELASVEAVDRQSWAQVGFGDQVLAADPLSDADSAWLLIKSVFDTITDVDGDAPDAAADSRRTQPHR